MDARNNWFATLFKCGIISFMLVVIGCIEMTSGSHLIAQPPRRIINGLLVIFLGLFTVLAGLEYACLTYVILRHCVLAAIGAPPPIIIMDARNNSSATLFRRGFVSLMLLGIGCTEIISGSHLIAQPPHRIINGLLLIFLGLFTVLAGFEYACLTYVIHRHGEIAAVASPPRVIVIFKIGMSAALVIVSILCLIIAVRRVKEEKHHHHLIVVGEVCWIILSVLVFLLSLVDLTLKDWSSCKDGAKTSPSPVSEEANPAQV